MPDQHSAASEHALMQEITAPLASLPDDPLPMAANIDFPIVLRGYDRIAVDAYVKKTAQLVAELQATRSPESAVRRAIERVGEEISGVLQRAHETAEQITSQSRREAEDRLEEARREAAQILSSAEQRLRDLDAETDRIWAERDRIVEDARELAGQLTTLASEAAARFVEEDETRSESPAEEGPAAAEPPIATDSVFDEQAPEAHPDSADPGDARADEDETSPEPVPAGGADDGRRTIVIPEHPEDFASEAGIPDPEEQLQRTNVMPEHRDGPGGRP